MASRAADLPADPVLVLIDDEYSAMPDDELGTALAAWLKLVRADGDPELVSVDAADAVRAERPDSAH